MTKTSPDCDATALSTSQPNRGRPILQEITDLVWEIIYADRRTNTAERDSYPDENAERISAWNRFENAVSALAATPAVGGEGQAESPKLMAKIESALGI